MIKITNGVQVAKVTNGAYEGIYKVMGFYPIVETKEVPERVEVKSKEVTEDMFVEELLEKPISEWSNDEIRKFAEIKTIDISKVKKAAEAKIVVKSWLEENEN